MAFRNSVKATLFEPEQPPSRPDEPRATSEEAAPVSTLAPAPSENAAKPAVTASPRATADGALAAAWHARAEELCALADRLPGASSWSLISKIACLYYELARDAGWIEPEALAPDGVRPEEPQAEEMPPAAPSRAQCIAFPRRPQPFGRRFPRRRA